MTTSLHIIAHPSADLDRVLRSLTGLGPDDALLGASVKPADSLHVGFATIGAEPEHDACRASHAAVALAAEWSAPLAAVGCRLDAADLGARTSFAAARQACFERSTADWRGWVDADDVVGNAAVFAALPGAVPDAADVIVCPYVYTWTWPEGVEKPQPGHVIDRERWLRWRTAASAAPAAPGDGAPLWFWRGRVHETIQRSEPGPAESVVHGPAVVWHMGHSNDPAAIAAKRARNRELLVATVWDRAEPDDERDRARAYLALDALIDGRHGDAREILLPAYDRESGPMVDVVAARQHVIEMARAHPVERIAILAAGSPIEWHPRSPEQGGTGGSEEAVVYVARELAKRGVEVEVYGAAVTAAERIDGVRWLPETAWVAGETHADLVIVWRFAMAASALARGQRAALWAHDIGVGECSSVDLARFDSILTLSEFQERCLRAAYKGAWLPPFVRIGNGLPDSAWVGDPRAPAPTRDPHRVVYASSPDRGLDRLLEMWPTVRAAVPDATLHVFYGWGAFDLIKSNDGAKQAERLAFKSHVQRLAANLTDHGVVWRGRVSQPELAYEMAAAGVWAYPTTFPEVFCITAARAEAAGLTPVATDAGSLPEVLAFADELVPVFGDFVPAPDGPAEPAWTAEASAAFTAALIDALRTPASRAVREALSEGARRCTWALSVDRLLAGVGVVRGAGGGAVGARDGNGGVPADNGADNGAGDSAGRQ